MGLENLKSVFNDLTKNVKEDFGGPNGQGVHGGLTNDSPSTPPHPTDHSIIANKFPNIATVAPDNESMSPTLSIGESGIETRFATISKQGATPIKKEELSILDGLPNIARVSPDNQSMSPTLENGKGLPIGNSVFLDATGISRFSIGVDPVAKHPTDFSILDGLPNIATVAPDNQSMNPTLNTGIGLSSRHSHNILSGDEFNPDTVSITSTHHENHSALDNIGDNLVERNLLRSTAPIQVLEIGDLEVVNYTPLVNSGVGINSGLQTFDGLLTGNMATRKFDITTLGKNFRLGEGDFTLGTLFKHNHRGSPQRTTIDTGKIDHKGNKIIINTGRAGIGSLSNLDIKGNSTFSRTGLLGPLAESIHRIATFGLLGGISDAIGDFGKEPYIVHNIPQGGFGSSLQGVGQNRDFIPWRAALDDASRLAQFYTSPAGIIFMAKENITNIVAGTESTVTQFGAIMAPPIPIPMTGFLNFYQQKAQGAGLGSIRKPFKIQYSDRSKIRLPFSIQGDRTIAIDQILARTSIPSGLPLFAKRALAKIRDGALSRIDEVQEFTQIPNINIPTPFHGLKSGPKYKPKDTFMDKEGTLENVSDTNFNGAAANSEPPKEQTTDIYDGDFYVRFRDLRKSGKWIYFRGYVTGITENVNPTWSPTNYIGRSEPVYNYERAERDVSFNLRVYPQNELQFKMMYEKIEHLTSLAYPEYLGRAIATDAEGNDVKFENETIRMQPPFTELYMAHIGDSSKGQFGFVKSLSYTVPGEGDWDAINMLPRLFDIAISYQILSKRPPGLGLGSTYANKFYGDGR